MSDEMFEDEYIELAQGRAYWQARAEAAENDLRELRENTLLALGLNPVDVTAGMEDQSIAYLLGGLKQRVAELEAQLAAQAWRPVDTAPTQELIELKITAHLWIETNCAYRGDTNQFIGTIPTEGWQWRPIDPPAPA